MNREDLTFKTKRQEELMRVVLHCFADFVKREQPYYGLEGMSTSHITVHAIQDFKTLRAFWPVELVEESRYSGTIYHLDDDTMRKVQTNVRTDLDKLQKAGYIEKIGNENERRWRPVKGLKGVTLD